MKCQLFSIISLAMGACSISCAFTTTVAPSTITRTTDQFNLKSYYHTNHIGSLHYKGSLGQTNTSKDRNLVKLHLSSSSSKSTSSSSSSLPNAPSMRASELRKELQSYGISTKSFFEKSELVEAVEKARREGKTSMGNNSGSDDSSENEKEASSSSSSSSSSSRSEKLAQEMEKCNKMKVGELKKELESYGVSTKSFFEKSEFVRAVAEARVDGVKSSSGGRRTTTGGAGRRASREEEYDPSYRDVQMQKMDPRSLGMGGMSSVIDVRLG